ncbi:MAG: helix-turn-helix domain-containing protein [Prolixibacteraceae bacterium]|nr:helix-turn-helix domain-containing protein [Prolixibacteraceae bacterium]
MKILPFKIAQPVGQSIWVQDDHLPHLYDILHRHNEFQITLIKKSTGNVVAGTRFIAFQPGDIFVFGSGLPHVLRNDPEYYQAENELKARALSVYFEKEIFGATFWNLPETKTLTEYMQKAGGGFFYPAAFHNSEARIVEEIGRAEAPRRLILLLELLNRLNTSKHQKILAADGMFNPMNKTDEKRLDAIFRFTLNEFHRPITLAEVAGVSNMTVNSFCRYFKTRTRKTYVDFLTEYRIGRACKMLLQEEYSISDICYRVGFGNLSNFNRKFKKINGCTPQQYRKKQKLQNILV